MYSHRLDWTAATNRISQAAAAHPPLFDLTVSNPTRAGFDYPASILDALRNPAALDYRPVTGHPETNTILCASTSEAYAYLFKLLCDPGDEVLVPRPSYPLFEFLARLDSVAIRHYSLHYGEGWWLDFPSLEAGITPRTRAVLFVNPNNPTGSYLKQWELQRLAALCAERGLALISDEVFADYPLQQDPLRVETLGGNGQCLTFTLGGLSKSAGLPQMKAAWLTASGPGATEAYQRLDLIADTYLSLSTPILLALPELRRLGQTVGDQIRRRTSQNLSTLHRMKLCPLHVEGGWYAILRAPRTCGEEQWAVDLLVEDGVLVQPGYFYDFESEGWIVISLLTPEAIFEEGLKRISARFGGNR